LFFVGLLSRLEVLAVGSLSHVQMGEGFGRILVHGLEVSSDIENVAGVLVDSSPLVLHRGSRGCLVVSRSVHFLLAHNVTHIHASLTAKVGLKLFLLNVVG